MPDGYITITSPTSDQVVTVSPVAPMVVSVGMQGPEGIQGPPGEGATVTGTCGADVAAGIAVVLVGGLLYPADPTNPLHGPLYVGISTEAGSTTDSIVVAQLGTLTTTGLTQGLRYFVGLLGVLSTMPVAVGGTWLRYVGTAASSTSLVLISSISILLD